MTLTCKPENQFTACLPAALWAKSTSRGCVPHQPTPPPVSLEDWSFEIMVLLSGLLENPEVEISVMGICVNTEMVQYMLPFGFGMATSTRVANELGVGNSSGAHFAVRAALRITLLQSGALALIFLLLRDVWGGVFNSDNTIIIGISQMMPLGLWGGLAIGLILQTCVLFLVVSRIQWSDRWESIELAVYEEKRIVHALELQTSRVQEIQVGPTLPYVLH